MCIRDLTNLDTLSKSDPMVVVFENRDDSGWKEVGRTEMIKNSLNPEFTKLIKMEYHFETNQKIRFDVYDVDTSPTDSLSGQDFIGSAEVLLSEMLTKRRFHYVEELHSEGKKGSRGEISVLCEEDDGNDDLVEFKIRGEDLDKKDLFGKSDPYFILYKKMSDGSWAKTYQSETIMKTLNPEWKKFRIRTWDLCGKDTIQEVKVECYDWDKHSSDDLIGEGTFTLEKMFCAKTSKSIELIHPKLKKSKKGYKNSGKLVFEKARKLPTFVDFLRGGLEINFMVAVDFTGSNGDPKSTSSLHYIDKDGNDNMYMKAIRSVGSILAAYDKDQKIPVYGFGADLPSGNVSHCFPLNGNDDDPEVNGIDGVMEAYKKTLSTVALCGPTYFEEIISTASKTAKEESKTNPYKYFILLILTDGIINDMSETVNVIVEAANNSPLSIVITGIGDANFAGMNRLDSDDCALVNSRGVSARRDIVQFVPFNKYANSPQMLAKETLAEIPEQVVEYMEMKDIVPIKGDSL